MGAYPSCSQARDNDVLFRTGQSCQMGETSAWMFTSTCLRRIDVD
jgi:hypothetical protein